MMSASNNSNSTNDERNKPLDDLNLSSTNRSVPHINSRKRPPPLNSYHSGNHYHSYPVYGFAGYVPPPPQKKTQCDRLGNNVDGREKFTVDVACSPCSTFSEAKAQLEARHGGMYNGKRFVMNDGNNNDLIKAGKKVVPRTKYHCRASGYNKDGSTWKCPWRAQIRQILQADQSIRFCIFKHKFHEKHCHPMDQSSDGSPLDCYGHATSNDHGMSPDLLLLVERYVQNESVRGVSVLSLKANSILSGVITVVRTRSTEYHDLWQHLRGNEGREKAGMQIRGYLSRKKECFIKQKLDGISVIGSNSVLKQVLGLFSLEIPHDYQANHNYKNAKEIAAALRVDDEAHMFIVDLTCGRVHDCYQRKAVKQTPANIRKFREKVEQSFMVFSPSGLFQLLSLAKRRPGTRVIGSDGSGGFCKNGSSFVTIGTPTVRLIRDSKKDVRSSLRTHVYLHLGGERLHPYCLSLYVLRDIAYRLFGIELELDWGISDHADAFVMAHNSFSDKPSLCDVSDTTNELQGVSQGDQGNPIQVCAAPVVSQLTQENDLGSTEGNPVFRRPDSALECYFHVQQCFTTKKNEGFASLFRDPELRDSNGLAYKQVRLIHLCKTFSERAAVSKLVLQHWREELNEHAAADRFEQEYCCYPYWNWNYCATGEAGVYPTNCPNESLNKLLKSTVQLNVNLPRLLVESLPNLLREDANLRSDPCTIRMPVDCEERCIALTGFYKDGTDCVELRAPDGSLAGYLCNLGYMIGEPITEDRWTLMTAALAGDANPFMSAKYASNTPGNIAKRMVRATNTLCHVSTNRDGHIIGDCENCYKRLGRGCPAATLIRDKHKRLNTCLDDMRKVPVNRKGKAYASTNSGNVQMMYTSGLSQDGRKPRQLKPMTVNFKSYLATLKTEQLQSMVTYLGLVHPSQKKKENVLLSHFELLTTLLHFSENTTEYRRNISVSVKSEPAGNPK